LYITYMFVFSIVYYLYVCILCITYMFVFFVYYFYICILCVLLICLYSLLCIRKRMININISQQKSKSEKHV